MIKNAFTFDQTYDTACSNETLFRSCIRPFVADESSRKW